MVFDVAACPRVPYVLGIPSLFGGWINAGFTELDCLLSKLAAPAGHDDLMRRVYKKPSTLLKRTLDLPAFGY
jgi:hypothetical protein